MTKKINIVEIFTDGACQGNPGPGGWGALLRFGEKEKTISGAEWLTTNNRMELTAAIEALKNLKWPCEVMITTDSEYLRKGITEWIFNWKKRNWKGSNGQKVKNQDLWEQLDQEVQRHHHVSWHWIRGHTGHLENERADELARNAIKNLAK